MSNLPRNFWTYTVVSVEACMLVVYAVNFDWFADRYWRNAPCATQRWFNRQGDEATISFGRWHVGRCRMIGEDAALATLPKGFFEPAASSPAPLIR